MTSWSYRVILSTSSTTTCRGQNLGIVGQEPVLDGRARSRGQGRKPRDSGGGAERRALTLAGTRTRCWSDDAASTTTSCGRRNSRIPQILELANTGRLRRERSPVARRPPPLRTAGRRDSDCNPGTDPEPAGVLRPATLVTLPALRPMTPGRGRRRAVCGPGPATRRGA